MIKVLVVDEDMRKHSTAFQHCLRQANPVDVPQCVYRNITDAAFCGDATGIGIHLARLFAVIETYVS